MAIQTKPTHCPHCHSHRIIKKGARKNQHRIIPQYRCKTCVKYFSTTHLAKIKYPPHVIIKAISLYNLGYSQSQVADKLAKRHRLRVPRRTISEWLIRYRQVCPYHQLRDRAMATYSPNTLLVSYEMEHRQVYEFKAHQFKLDHLLPYIPKGLGSRLRGYLESVPTSDYPHHLFQPVEAENDQVDQSLPVHRSSKIQLETLPLVQTEKQNLANDLASLGLLVARTTRERHPSIQDFMLINDSSTIACEVPVYLTAEDMDHYQQQGFYISYPPLSQTITGHIDLLQIRGRSGQIHILDYKPDSHKIQPISQLVTYALALGARTRIPLKHIKCAWFDEKHFFEFFPLAAIYPKS